MPGDGLSRHRRVGVDQRGDPEAAGGEAAVVGERGAEVTDTDDDDRPVLGQAELAGDLVDEVLDVVADTAGPVGAEVREVLAQLRGVDPGRGRELLGGDRGHRALGQRGEGAQIQRKPGDGGLGDSSATGRRSVSSASCHGAPAGRAGLQAVVRPRTAPSNAGYVFVNACTKMVSDLSGQRDRGHARLDARSGTTRTRPSSRLLGAKPHTLLTIPPPRPLAALRRSYRRRSLARRTRLAQPLPRSHTPEVVLRAVHQDDRDLLPVLPVQLLVLR